MSGVKSSVMFGRIRKRFRIGVLVVLGPVLSGCILGTERPDLNLEVPANYRAAPKADADAAVPMLDWWRGFRSKELSSLERKPRHQSSMGTAASALAFGAAR